MHWKEIPLLETDHRYYRAPDGRVAVLGGKGPPKGREALWVDRRRPLIVDLDRGRRVQIPLWTEGAEVCLTTVEPLRCAIDLARALGSVLVARVRGRTYVLCGDELRAA